MKEQVFHIIFTEKSLLSIIIVFYCEFIKNINNSLKKRSHVKMAALLLITNDIRLNYSNLVLVFSYYSILC